MAEKRLKPFAAFDIDGTLIRWQLYHAITDALVKLGHVELGKFDSVRDARMSWKKREESATFRSYELELIKAYEEVLKEISVDKVDEAIAAVFEEYRDQTYIYTRQLIEDLKANDYTLLAISGSQIEIIELIAKHFGFDDFIGTVYERENGRFSGEKTVAAHDKAAALKRLVEKHGLSFIGSIAIGDSRSDAAMLELVEQPIAFNPDQDLFEIAQKSGWKIVLERKNMVYELEQVNGQYQLAETNVG